MLTSLPPIRSGLPAAAIATYRPDSEPRQRMVSQRQSLGRQAPLGLPAAEPG